MSCLTLEEESHNIKLKLLRFFLLFQQYHFHLSAAPRKGALASSEGGSRNFGTMFRSIQQRITPLLPASLGSAIARCSWISQRPASVQSFIMCEISRGLKSHSGMRKRIRIRGSGGLKRWSANHRHNTGPMSRIRCHRLGSSVQLKGTLTKGKVKKVKQLIGTG